MWLQAPDAPTDVLWEGQLEPAAEQPARRGEPGFAGETADIRNLPVVSVGQPDVWALEEIYPRRKMSPLLRAKAAEADFYLARLWCSFRPLRRRVQIEWARFWVHLLDDEAGNQPTAFDMYPREVTREVQRNVKVTLDPELKFAEVGINLGTVEFGFEYTQLEPVVTASGIGEPKPDWSYERARGISLQGSKWMHLLIKAPQGMPSGRAVFDIAADIDGGHRLLRALAVRDRRQAESRLSAALWG